MSHIAPEADSFTVTLLTPEGERTLRASRDQYLWDAAQSQGIDLPALCHRGRCLTCAGRLEGPGEVDQRDSDQYFPEDREAGFVLLCTGKPQSDLRIRTHQQHEMRRRRGELDLPAPYA